MSLIHPWVFAGGGLLAGIIASQLLKQPGSQGVRIKKDHIIVHSDELEQKLDEDHVQVRSGFLARIEDNQVRCILGTGKVSVLQTSPRFVVMLPLKFWARTQQAITQLEHSKIGVVEPHRAKDLHECTEGPRIEYAH